MTFFSAVGLVENVAFILLFLSVMVTEQKRYKI